MFNLISPEGGDCLITSGIVRIHHEASLCLSKLPKWSSYMEDIDQYNPPYPNDEDVRKYTIDLMEDAGFKDYTVELRDREYIFHLEDYKSEYKLLVQL